VISILKKRSSETRRFFSFRSFSFGATLLALFVSSAHGDSADSTNSVSKAYFGVSKLSRNSMDLTEGDSAILAETRDAVLGETKISGETFWRILAGDGQTPEGLPSRGEILQRLADSPIYVCASADGCPCPAEAPYGCSQARAYGGGRSVAFLIDPCVMPNGISSSCSKSRTKTLLKIAQRNPLQWAMRRAIAHGAVRLVQPNLSGPRLSERLDRLVAEFSDSAELRARLISACPGKLPAVGSAMLLRAGLLQEIENPYVRECGRNYVAPLFAPSTAWEKLPAACVRILDQARWNAWKALAQPSLGRCEGLCAELTCWKGPVLRPPRVLWFGSQPWIDLPQDACTGPEPKQEFEFFTQQLLPYLVKPSFGSPSLHTNPRPGSAEGAWSECLLALGVSPDPARKDRGAHAPPGEWDAPLNDISSE
jgi:hypothetical protein